MRIEDKGSIVPAPQLTGALREVACAVAARSGVVSAAHWNLYERTRVDGVDFFIGELEISHVHFYGEARVPTEPTLRDQLLRQGIAQCFRYAAEPSCAGWVQCSIRWLKGATASIKCFRVNYRRLNGNEVTDSFGDVIPAGLGAEIHMSR